MQIKIITVPLQSEPEPTEKGLAPQYQLSRSKNVHFTWKKTCAADSVVEPEPPFLAEAVKKGAAPAPALQLKL